MQREQTGTIIQIGSNWHLRWWERRNIGGTIQRKRVSHRLGAKTTRGRTPPAQIVEEAKRYMNNINRGQLPAETHNHNRALCDLGLLGLDREVSKTFNPEGLSPGLEAASPTALRKDLAQRNSHLHGTRLAERD